jgi:hypothetical protein
MGLCASRKAKHKFSVGHASSRRHRLSRPLSFLNKIMKTKKSTDILSGQNLLIVKSIHSHKAELSKFKYLITVTIVYVVFIICLFAFTQRINFEIV